MSVLQEIRSERFASLPPAVLDESKAPQLAVVTRMTGQRMLRGRIEHTDEGWTWHFVLDTDAPHEGTGGVASSYEAARGELVEALRAANVRVNMITGVPLPRA